MSVQKKIRLLAIIAGSIALLALSQPVAPTPDPTIEVPNPNQAPDNSPPPDIEVQNAPDAQIQDDWVPAPDNEEFNNQIATEPKVTIKKSPRPILSDVGGIGDDSEYSDVTINSEDENLSIIAQTQHRKREIDPAKKLDLIELSRVLGSLHAIRTSCAGASDQTYRSKMNTMLEMEAPSATFLSEPLTAAFNQGFVSLGGGETPCPDDNGKTEAVHAKKGYAIAIKLSDYYLKLTQNDNKRP